MQSNLPIAVPDYASPDDWDEFVSMFPDDERMQCPSFFEVRERLESFCDKSEDNGLIVHRINIKANEWIAWVRANDKPLSRSTLGEYAAFMYARQQIEKEI